MYKFIECVGSASTTGFRNGKRLGHNVNVAAYIDNISLIVKLVLESNGSKVRGIESICMTKDSYEIFCEKKERRVFLRALDLFGVETNL